MPSRETLWWAGATLVALAIAGQIVWLVTRLLF